MEDMTLQDEWLSQILGQSTKKSYAKGMGYFLEFLELRKCEDLKTLSKPETRTLQFYQWLQTTKGLSSNSARARIVPVQSFFTYIDRPLKLKHKLPQIHAKVENWKPDLETLQKIYALGDISVKCWMSLSRDVPARMSDMVKITNQLIQSGEFQILSQKEKVMGMAYTSQETRDLFKQLENSKINLPRTQRGVDKMMTKACQIAGTVKRLNQHLWRKLFISKAIDLGISEMIWKLLTFKTVPATDATYFLNGSELGTYWEKITTAIPLEKKANGKASQLDVDIIAKALARMINRELGYQTPTAGLGLLVEESPMETLKRYLESKT